LLPAWLAAFRLGEPTQRRPHVEIVNSHGVIALVRDGRAEIGFIESLEPVDGPEALMLGVTRSSRSSLPGIAGHVVVAQAQSSLSPRASSPASPI
jgi:DNA-binding transcriptional LysR family regulator